VCSDVNAPAGQASGGARQDVKRKELASSQDKDSAAGQDKDKIATAGLLSGEAGTLPQTLFGMSAMFCGAASMTEVTTPETYDFMSAATALCTPPKSKAKFEGILLYCDPEPRAIKSKVPSSPQRQRGHDDTQKSALDLILGDNTGPIGVTLWNAAASSFMHDLALVKSQGAASASGAITVSLDIVEIQVIREDDWNGPTLTSMRVLHSISPVKTRVGTNVVLHRNPTSPYLVGSVCAVPTSSVCASVFSAMRGKLVAPFRATIKGVIAELQSLDYTQQGNEVRYFKLVDGSGHFIRCAAMAHNATSTALVNQNEVVLYFGTGRGPIGALEGQLYALKNAAIVSIGRKFLPADPTHDVDIKAKD